MGKRPEITDKIPERIFCPKCHHLLIEVDATDKFGRTLLYCDFCSIEAYITDDDHYIEPDPEPIYQQS